MNAKVAFPELVRLVARATGTTQRMSELFIKELFATISQALMDGQDVTVKGLGKFSPTGSGSRRQVDFTPDKSLAAAVNLPFAAFDAVVLSRDMTDRMLTDLDEAAQPERPGPQPEQPAVPPERPEPQPEAVLASPAPTAAPDPDTGLAPLLAAEPLPAPVPVAPVAQVTHEPEEPVPTMQQYRQAELERVKAEATHRSFLLGMLTGALATLILAAIVWSASRSSWGSPAPAPPDTAALRAAEATASATVGEASAARSSATVVTDTCSATMYLSKMSTKHYGKPDFWIYIYEENRDKIANPDNVPPGTVVVVPPAEKYGINPADKSSIDRARRRTYELLTEKR